MYIIIIEYCILQSIPGLQIENSPKMTTKYNTYAVHDRRNMSSATICYSLQRRSNYRFLLIFYAILF